MMLKKSSSFLLSAIALGLLAMTGCADFGGNLGFEINAQEEQQGEPGKLGGPCRTDGSKCDPGLVCDSSTKTCQKPGAGELDGKCLSGAGRKCKGDLVCSEDACVEACPSGKLIHPVSRECVDAQCDQYGTPPNLNCGTGKFCADKFCIREEDRCELTAPCDTGYKCEAGACVPDCAAEQVCNGVCCGSDEVCFKGKAGDTCVAKPTDGKEVCFLNNNDEPQTCDGAKKCVLETCVDIGDSCNLEKVEYCPANAFCDETVKSCVKYSQLPAQKTCVAQLGDDYDIVEVLQWQGPNTGDDDFDVYNQVITMPLAFDIDGNGKGDLIFSAYKDEKGKDDRYKKSVLFVIEGVAGSGGITDIKEHWNSQNLKSDPPFFVDGSVTMALGDIDPLIGDGPEIIAITYQDNYTENTPAQLIAINAKSAKVKWRSKITENSPYRYPTGVGDDFALTIVDLDGDDEPEILTPFEVRSGKDGRLLCKYNDYSTFNTAISRAPVAVNLDDDDNLEIVGGGRIRKFTRGGGVCPKYGTDYAAFKDDDGLRMIAVADLVGDGKPEIIVTNGCRIYVFDHTNRLITEKGFPEANETGCSSRTAGAPTVANFDGDGKPEIAVAGPVYYTVYKYDKNATPPKLDVVWKFETKDSSGKTGAAAFDFKGDGIAEIVYSDEKDFRIFHGKPKTTQTITSTQNDSGTIIESPIVVDLNNDGSAEIVFATNQWGYGTGSPTHGLRVFKEKHNRWVGTRPIWNQYAFQPTYINDDGTIPVKPPKYWEKDWSNNFRQNLQNTSKLAAELKPEFDSISMVGTCGTSNKRRINFRILNDGDKEVPAGRFKTIVSISKAGKDNWVETVAIDKNQGAVPARGSLDAYVEVTLPPSLSGEDLDIKITVDVNEQVVECNEGDNKAIAGVAANVVSPNQNLALKIDSLDDLQCVVDPRTLNLKLKIESTGPEAILANTVLTVDLYVGSGGQYKTTKQVQITTTKDLGNSESILENVEIKLPEEYQGKLLEVYGVVGSANVSECTTDDNRAEYNQPLLCY